MSKRKNVKTGAIVTERGLLYIDRVFDSVVEANSEGYMYAFTSQQHGNIYSMPVDKTGYRHSFALIRYAKEEE